MVRKRCMALAAIIVSLGCLLSCGLEAFYYLDYVPDASVTTSDISVTVGLPTASTEGYGLYFTHFIIFYRIYISAALHEGLVSTATERNAINPALNYDFNLIDPLTNKTSTTVNTSNLESSFYNRNYFQLLLEGPQIGEVLSSSSLGSTLEIYFSRNLGELPRLSLNGGAGYPLLRANSGLALTFNPLPDNRYFLNHYDLYNGDNATSTVNADVANRTQTDPPSQYTYVSMYIAAVGKEYLTTVYSQPTHLGIFRLANSS